MKFTPVYDEDLSSPYVSAAAAVEHAIGLVESLLARPVFELGLDDHLEMRRELPYCAHPMDIEGVQILVNRDYKPVGCELKGLLIWARYEKFPNLHVRLDGPLFFFSDSSAPWNGPEHAAGYLGRLRSLLQVLSSAESKV